MSCYPGWGSLASVERWHSFYEIAGIVCLALLVGAEILPYQYGHRKDVLVGFAEEQRQQEAKDAESGRKIEVERLQKQLSEADKKMADLQKGAMHRNLRPDQKLTLIGALKSFPGQKVSVRLSWVAMTGWRSPTILWTYFGVLAGHEYRKT